MPRIQIDADRRQEICASLVGLSGPRAVDEVNRWAKACDVHPSRIYDITRHLRPPRKARSDKGRRHAPLLEHAGMRTVAEFVVTKKLDPDQAIEMARANGHDVPVSLGTTRRYLREKGLNRRKLRRGVRPYRSFEANAPGEIYQFDISGVKERWIDLKTRRVLHVTPLEVSKNHPNTKASRVALWKFVLVDDHSRFRFVRFIACRKPDSEHVIDFLLDAFREMGIPKVLYTDNDAIIVSRRMRRAASILDRAFTDSGGFKLEQHLPGNPQATGKVESSHQLIEKYERNIGAREQVSTLEELNNFTIELCKKLNWTIHRSTGEIPAVRFLSTQALRMPADETLNAAFKSLPVERLINPDLTISVEGAKYQLPRSAMLLDERNPFLDWIGQKVEFIWPPESETYFVALGLKGSMHEGRSWEIDRVIARADRSGEFKAPAESIAQRATKELTASAAEKRAARKVSGDKLITPGFEVPFEIAAQGRAGVQLFPPKRIETSPELLAALGADVLPPSMVNGRMVDYWTAASLLADEGSFIRTEAGQISACDMSWLKSVFNGRDQMLDTEIRAALSTRAVENLREIRSA